ncbi:MAG: squalene/phytoene synthase family protein, partial [Gemmatimonadota bacterium]|nr:squalene/phytoene synthase family protein [Gemmatimonadota bacterium]
MGAATSLDIPPPRLSETEYLRTELVASSTWARSGGMAVAELQGQLIRPMVSLAGWRSLSDAPPPPEFWSGAMAVQLAHEASLLHDDVVDGAARRRGIPTLAATRGVAAALVRGDHLLTTAYRYAARTRSTSFIELFARSVERTVAGELAQARATGRMLDFEEYSEIARGKSGELLGCALSLGPSLCEPERAENYHAIGCRIGLVYQMLDDLLDLCPSTDTGKPALTDFAQKHWTWPLQELKVAGFGAIPGSLLDALHRAAPGGAAISGCLNRYDAEVESVSAEVEAWVGGSTALNELLEGWRQRAHEAVAREVSSAPEAAPAGVPSAVLLARANPASSEGSYLARHSRSFRFATRFFPARDGDRVARVYAWCRFTDDLVDDPVVERVAAAALLDEWMTLSQRAYDGLPSGIPFLDRVMGEMSAARVPFRYAAELAEGMRMDLRGERYESMAELRRYTYRVASVVGLWVSELFDVRDPEVLVKAESMGHAMQLTNILRDVGEDLRVGRCYL